MKVGILGSGAVGVTLAKGLLAEGHEVVIATREPNGEKAPKLNEDVPGATIADFATTATEADLAVLCVKGEGLEDIISLIGPENLAGKVVVDTTNLIEQVDGALVYAGEGASAAEHVQNLLPDSKVVKAFNTVGAAMMYKPDFDDVTPTMFIAGNDAEAKRQVSDIVTMFGWEPLDCGNLVQARSLEPMALVWINNAMSSGSPQHAFKML